MKLHSHKFIDTLPVNEWISFDYPRIWYIDNWVYFTELWNFIEGVYFNEFSKIDIILDDYEQKFKIIERVEKSCMKH